MTTSSHVSPSTSTVYTSRAKLGLEMNSGARSAVMSTSTPSWLMRSRSVLGGSVAAEKGSLRTTMTSVHPSLLRSAGQMSFSSSSELATLESWRRSAVCKSHSSHCPLTVWEEHMNRHATIAAVENLRSIRLVLLFNRNGVTIIAATTR